MIRYWLLIIPYSISVAPLAGTVLGDLVTTYAQEQYALQQAHNPYAQTRAIRWTAPSMLSPDEQQYTQQRCAHIAHVWSERLGCTVDVTRVPRIAVVCSGGGTRAMLYAIGALRELEAQGLLAISSWIVTLSGSTWALCSKLRYGVSWADFQTNIVSTVSEPLYTDIAGSWWDHAIKALATKAYGAQLPITWVDVYGLLLAQRFLPPYDPLDPPTVSQQAHRMCPTQDPIPLYTSISIAHTPPEQPDWLVCSPFGLGCAAWGVAVPLWAVGRTFDTDGSCTNTPEQSVGFYMGTFGSIFAVQLEQVLTTTGINTILQTVLQDITPTAWHQDRMPLSWAQLPNFTQGMPNLPATAQGALHLCDAGVCMNLPFPAVLDPREPRQADVILCIDASNDIASGNELTALITWAATCGAPLAHLNPAQGAQSACTIWTNTHDPHTPVVIYLPMVITPPVHEALMSDTTYGDLAAAHHFDITACLDTTCDTFNFVYSPPVSEGLMCLAQANIRWSAPAIWQALTQKVICNGTKTTTVSP